MEGRVNNFSKGPYIDMKVGNPRPQNSIVTYPKAVKASAGEVCPVARQEGTVPEDGQMTIPVL